MLLNLKNIKFLDNYIFIDSSEDSIELNKLNNLKKNYCCKEL